ncbi:MAG: hypothetical protein IT452_09980, partial [Planctomycetia bacterium]|nr:hypothetical protein [Planctomycetia bacterium]
ATTLVDRARAEAIAKPPDKKEVTFTYKNVITWRDMDATSIANDAKGAVFMVDYSSQILYELDVEAKQKRSIPLKVPASHKLAFDPKGRLYVSTYKYWAIHEVDLATGASLRNFAGKGSEDGKIANLIDFVVAPSGDLFVLDASLYRLSQFGADGAFRSKSGIRFNRDTQEPSFWVPSGLAVDSEGRLYTGDSELHAIKRFKKDGTFDKVLVTNPQFYPGPMACGRNRLYVADMKLCKILVFSMDGVQIGAVAGRGDLAQQLAKPNGVAIDAAGRVFIADGRKKVVVYEEDK